MKCRFLIWGALLWAVVVMMPEVKAQMRPNRTQELLSEQVLKSIERQKQEEVIRLLDPADKKSVNAAKSQLPEAVKAIRVLRSKGAYSTVMAVGGRDGYYRLYRCRYHIEGERQQDFYQIDVYFKDENSTRIGKLLFKHSAQLLKAQLDRERDNSAPPTAPPKVKE